MSKISYNSDALARTHDPKTSWEAAEKVDTNRLESLVLTVVRLHGADGATHDQVFNYLEDTQLWKKYTAIMPRESSITPRYKQLENKGLILQMGARGGNIIPNNAIGGGGTTNMITVNVDATGSSVAGNGSEADQLGGLIASVVQATIIDEQRAGGLLNR